MFEFEFMRKAFIVGGLLAIIIPLIGSNVVFKRLSLIGDALSHVSLSGVVIGLIVGVNPIVTAIISSLVAVIFIEATRKSFKQYSELSIAVVMSFGIGLAGFLLKYVNNAANFESFLFGSIVTITNFEMYLIIFLALTVILIVIFFYRDFLYVSFDEQSAQLAGVKVKRTNYLLAVLIAITVSVASRTVGALVVSSMMVIPIAIAVIVAKSYKQTLIIAILLALSFMFAGITLSFYFDFKPGGTIVLLSIITLVVILVVKYIYSKVRKIHH